MRNPLKGFLMVALIVSLIFSLIPVLTPPEQVRAEETLWIQLSNNPLNIMAIAINPTNTQMIYAGGSGVFKSTDGGSTWRAANNGLTNTRVYSLAIDPTNTQTIYVGTGRGVFKSTDGGSSWNPTGLIDINVVSLAIDPSNTQVIYAGVGSSVFKSSDGGLTWSAISNGLKDGEVNSLVIDPSNTQVIYAGTSDIAGVGSGVFKSTDGGSTWSQMSNGLTNSWVNSLAIDPANTQVIYAGTSDYIQRGGGVFKSTNGGISWYAMNIGLSSSFGCLAIDPSNTQVIYAGTSGGVFKSANGGTSWSAINIGLSSSFSCLVVDPSNTQVIYAGLGGVFKSEDGGFSWNSMSNGLSGGVLCLAINPTNTQLIYAGTEYSGVFKSSNGGLSWNAINSGLTDLCVYSFAIDPTNTQTIYAGTESGGVFKSTDGGASWTQINNGLTNTRVSSLAIDPKDTETIYAGTSACDVFRSKDGGSIWNENWLRDPGPDWMVPYKVCCLAVDPSNMNAIYAGTNLPGGIFKAVSMCGITSSTGTGGRISPSGKVLVTHSSSQTFAIIADSNCKISIVKVDGKSIGPVSSYTFTNITQDHTIEATFEPLTFAITSSSGVNGTISPSGKTTVNYGSSKTFTITPSYGYKISNVKVDGKSVGPVSSYTFTNITQDHTIEALFEKEKKETVIILQTGSKNFTVNGETRTLDSPSVIKNNRTLLPIRAVVEALGGNVEWIPELKFVKVTLGLHIVSLQIGSSTAQVDGNIVKIDPLDSRVVPVIINNRTMLPLRFVAESLGCTVDWDGTTKTITITYQP